MRRNFVDPIPLDVLPAVVNTREDLAGASVINKFQITTAFPRVSSGFVDVYEEYVPRLVPHGPRSVSKRERTDGSSFGLPASKKSHKPSTPPGTPVVASILLGEIFILFVPLFSYFYLDPSTFVLFSAGALVALDETE